MIKSIPLKTTCTSYTTSPTRQRGRGCVLNSLCIFSKNLFDFHIWHLQKKCEDLTFIYFFISFSCLFIIKWESSCFETSCRHVASFGCIYRCQSRNHSSCTLTIYLQKNEKIIKIVYIFVVFVVFCLPH